MTTVPTVYVIDNDRMHLRITGRMLESAGMATESFDSANAFLEDYGNGSPGCLLMDLDVCRPEGLDLLRRMREARITLPVLIITATASVSTAVEGMRLGAFDFVEKPVEDETLIAMVRTAIDADSNRRLESSTVENVQCRLDHLTLRERELLQFIASGLSNKQIAPAMGISVRTVENHRARLMVKTGATNAADLVRMHLLVRAASRGNATPFQIVYPPEDHSWYRSIAV